MVEIKAIIKEGETTIQHQVVETDIINNQDTFETNTSPATKSIQELRETVIFSNLFIVFINSYVRNQIFQIFANTLPLPPL